MEVEIVVLKFNEVSKRRELVNPTWFALSNDIYLSRSLRATLHVPVATVNKKLSKFLKLRNLSHNVTPIY